jgi:arylsulfatase
MKFVFQSVCMFCLCMALFLACDSPPESVSSRVSVEEAVVAPAPEPTAKPPVAKPEFGPLPKVVRIVPLRSAHHRAEGKLITIYEIKWDIEAPVDLETLSLPDGWFLRTNSVGLKYLHCEASTADPLEFAVEGKTVHVKFLQHPRAGHVLFELGGQSDIFDLFNESPRGVWLTVDRGLRRYRHLWSDPKLLDYKWTLARQEAIVDAIGTSGPRATTLTEGVRLEPWPQVPGITTAIPAKLVIPEVFMPIDGALVLGMRYDKEDESISAQEVRPFLLEHTDVQIQAEFHSALGLLPRVAAVTTLLAKGKIAWVELNIGSRFEDEGRLELSFDAPGLDFTEPMELEVIYPRIQGKIAVSSKKKNVIFFTLDTTRADHLSVYGYKRKTTPFLEEIAAQSIVYENAYSQTTTTRPSHCSIFTSRYCKDTEVYDNRGMELPLTDVTLAEVFKSAGWRTGAAVSASLMAPDARGGLAQGFDEYINPLASAHNQLGEETTIAAKDFIRNHAEEPFFLWIHYYDAHMPYQPIPEYRNLFWEGGPPPEEEWDVDLGFLRQPREGQDFFHYLTPHREYMTAMYDASLRYQDDQIRSIFEYLGELGLLSDTIVVIAADHGESLGEHDMYFTHSGLFEPTVGVPLIVYAPDHPQKGTRVSTVVENLNAAPTVLDLVGLESPRSFMRASLFGREPLSDTAFFEHGSQLAQGFRKGFVKFMDERVKKKHKDFPDTYLRGWYAHPEFAAYDLRSDTAELSNLLDANPVLLGEFLRFLSEWYGEDLGKGVTIEVPDEESVPDEQFDPKLLEALEALGYLK